MKQSWLKNVAYTVFSLYGVLAGYGAGMILGMIAGPKFLARLWSLANSNIAIATISTLVAAYAGTSGAQLLAEWNARRKDLLAEIRGTNAAIGLAFNIANTFVTTKKQHVRDLVDGYERACAARDAHYAALAEGRIPPGTPFEFELELKTISPPYSPIEGLEKILLERISPDGNAVVMLTPLVQSIRGFAETVAQRNRWIEEIKEVPADDHQQKANLYFGLHTASGRTDERYPAFMQALRDQTDDCIAYSMMIAKSLKQYGDRMAAQFGRGAPKIAAPDFSPAGDLLPDMAPYSSWLTNST